MARYILNIQGVMDVIMIYPITSDWPANITDALPEPDKMCGDIESCSDNILTESTLLDMQIILDNSEKGLH
jgi:hypothetical protein